MGNNNTKTGQSSSGSRIPEASRNQEASVPNSRTRVVFVHNSSAQYDNGLQFAASRVNNLPQNNFPAHEHFQHMSENRNSNNVYPRVPPPPYEPSNTQPFFCNNPPGNPSQINREPLFRVPVTHPNPTAPEMHPNPTKVPSQLLEMPNKGSELPERPKVLIDTSELLELSNKDPSNIVRSLQDKKVLFENTMLQSSLPQSVLEVLMKIVRKICFADTYSEKIELLKIVCSDKFLNTLGIYILSVPTHQKDCAKEDVLFLEGNVLPFFETILRLIPSLICHKLRDLLIQTNLALNGLQQYHNIKIDETTRMKLKKLEKELKHHLNPDSPDSSEEGKAQPASVQESSAEEDTSKGGPGHSVQAQAKHLEFLSRHIFPSVINKLQDRAHRVQGMSKNIYFVDYIKSSEEDAIEGEFLLAVAKYLLKQKYKADDILLFTTSDEDLKNILEIKSKYESLQDLQVGLISRCNKFDATIILISCPVSKTDVQNIYCERQLCQALLGAKNGVFMMGNLSFLENLSPFWKEMKKLLQQQEAVSTKLPLLCELHQIVINVSEANDLKKLKNGACLKRCEKKLKCGHLCKRLCHFEDREHKYYKCHEPCSSLKCFQKKLLPCGHSDPRKEKSGPQLDLWSTELAFLCQVPCSAVLECGHTCTGTCGSCRQGRVHLPCKNQSKITLACGHRFVSICNGYVQQCEQKCFYECPHAMCKERCGIPCTPCKEMCTIGCEHSKCNKKCFELCDRRPCFEPCKKLLVCGHKCVGICGEPCPPGPEYCRVCNAQKMKKKDGTGEARFVLLSNCNHVVRSNDLDRKAFSKVQKLESLACPLCGYNITKTTRYLNYAKELHRHLIVIRHVQRKYQENITTEFWKIAKEIRSMSLPKEIENHTKIEEIKKQFQVVQETKIAEQKPMILLMFLRNLLYPIVDGCSGLASPHHLDWLLILLLERFEMGLCSQVLRELYKEIIEYQKLKGKVYQKHVLELHKTIAFFTYLEKNTWMKCAKGHLTTYHSLLIECGSCQETKGLNVNEHKVI
ncbi:Uncharacterized protein GBIM_02000 [Gryllus bimaculatus]|nr:Uncharacterized protein GBIM_02000 [Gryllus bimaculatus]